MGEVDYTCASLSSLMRALSKKEQLRALRSALRREAGRVARAARAELRKVKTKRRRSGRKELPPRPVAKARELGKNVVGRTRRKLDGFTVAVRNRGDCYMHRGRNGLKPIAFWLNQGTGRGIAASDFIQKGRARAGGIEERLVGEMRRQVERIINKKFAK